MTLLLASQPAPDFLPKSTALTLTFPVRLNGALVAPASGTIALVDASGTSILSATAVTITSSVATYSLGSSVLTSTTIGPRNMQRWTLVFTSYGTIVYDRPFYVVAAVPYCPVSDLDLDYIHDGIGGYDPNTHAWQEKIDLAWEFGLYELEQAGENPSQIKDLHALKPWIAYKTLALIAEDLATEEAGEGKWTREAGRYRRLEGDAWKRLGYSVDRDNDNVIDTTGAVMASPDVYLSGPAGRRW